MPTIDITSLNVQKLKAGEYQSVFPEYYNLKNVEENGPWHDHQSVFDHVVGVYEGLETELKLTEFTESETQLIRSYFQQKIGNQTREYLLKVATLLHDIAKTATLTKNPNGTANCPGHEHIGAGMVKHFAERFGLDAQALQYVEQMVLHHGFISDILYQVEDKPAQKDTFWQYYFDSAGEVAYIILFLMRADLRGSDLSKTSPEKYQFRLDLLLEWMKNKSPNI